MRLMLDMFSKTWFINIILAACVAFLGAKSVGVWSEKAADVEQNVQKHLQAQASDSPRVTRVTLSPEGMYEVVAAKDLFISGRAERVEVEEKETIEETPAVEKDIRISGKKIILYGVVMSDGYKAALISDPQPKPQKRPLLWVREGENIGDTDIVVSAIEKESIVLKNKDNLIEISLYDQEKNRERIAKQDKQKPEQQPVVVTTQSTTTAKVGGSSPAPAKPAASSAAKSGGEGTTSSEEKDYKIVKTPFGEIKRRIK